MIWAFGDFELDEGLYQLRSRGRVVKLEPKVFDVLLHLLRHRERVVSKGELLDALWSGEAVSDSVLPRAVAAARRALGDQRRRPRVLQTVHGRGYRFVAELREIQPMAAKAPVGARAPDAGFIGREAAMARLREALDAACAGRARVVLLVGEPGIGKTRTAEELGAAAQRRGARWLAGRSYEGEGAPAFWPWRQILRACAEGSPAGASAAETGAGDLSALAPEPSERLPSLAPGAGLEGEQARFRLFESVAERLRRAAARTPLVATLDDLHWADRDSLLLFRFLARELRDVPLLLVGTYRDVEVRREHPLKDVLGALAREEHCERIALRGLGCAEVAALVERSAGRAPAPALLEALVELTEGNPFFVQEIVQLLLDEGRFDPRAGEGDGAWSLTLPQGVRDVIGRRLDKVSEPCNELLRVGSVLGREFGLRLLEDVTGRPREALLEGLGEALAAQLVVELPGEVGRFAFRHALVRQTLYDELSVPRRVALHRAAGEALEAAARAGADAPLAELAHHCFAALPAGGAEQAVRWSRLAAARAHELCAYEESARHYARALEALALAAAPDAALRCELAIELGEELCTAGARERGRARLAEAADLARRLARPDLFARAAIAYRGFGEMGIPPDAKTLALLEEARDVLGDAHPALRARLLARLAGTPPFSLSMETRERLSQEAQALARRSGERLALLDAVGARYWATLGPDRLDERLAVAQEAFELAARFEDRRLEVLAHEMALGARLARGELCAADLHIESFARLAEELRQPVFRCLASAIRASRAINRGEFAEGERLMREALERGRGSVPFTDLTFAGQIFFLQAQRGESEPAVEWLAHEGGRFRLRFAGMENVLRTLEASAALASGRAGEARRALEALAAREFRDLERDEHWLMNVSLLASLAWELGDAPRGALLYALLLPYRELAIAHDLLRGVAGSVEHPLGLLASLAGRHDAALEHLERALAKEEGMGTKPAALRSRVALAAALRARGRAQDAERAARLEREARREAARLGCRLRAPAGPGRAR
jgi:DNA-binding winged helix-turn-helix (wHTH) protein